MYAFGDSAPLHTELDCQLPQEQVTRQLEARKFARQFMRPASQALDNVSAQQILEREEFLSFFREAYGRKLHLLAITKDIGGEGLSLYERTLIFEELGWGSAGLALSLVVSQVPYIAMAQYGTSDIAKKFLLPYISDRKGKCVGCFPVTESAHGSDLFFIGMSATEQEVSVSSRLTFETDAYFDSSADEWVINGRKAPWITNSSVATLAFVIATAPTGAPAGFLVPLDARGVKRGEPLEKMGQRDMNQAPLTFDSVRIPSEYMLVRPEEYRAFHVGAFGSAYVLIGAVCVGIARAAFEEAVGYCRTRVQGGQVLIRHQDVQRRLMDLFAEVELMRSYVRSLARHYSSQPTTPMHYSAIARGLISQKCLNVCSEALELFGHVGLSKASLIEKLYRDARMARMMGGAGTVVQLRGALGFLL